MPLKVRVSALAPDAVFRTCLTRRIGVVLDEPEYDGIPVYLDFAGRDEFEEKLLAPEIIVEVDEAPQPAPAQVMAEPLTIAA